MTATHALPPRANAGFTLIEVLVSMVLLAVALLALAPLSYQVARMSTQATISTQRSAVLNGEVQRVEVMDFSTLSAGSTCTTFSSADFPHTKCVTVTDLGPNAKRVTVIVTPLGGGAPDTTIVERYRGGRSNPLKP